MDLNSVSVGDALAVHDRNGVSAIELVTKITKTLVMTAEGRYRKKDGRPPGQNLWGSYQASPVTMDDREDLRVRRFRHKVHNRLAACGSHVARMSPATLEVLMEALNTALEAGRGSERPSDE